MSPPPTNIDGTDITRATIDGQEVQEITVDGVTVFTPSTNPVAYGNMVAWYPFDPGFYGGSAADDCTALFNPSDSGDSTAYDGTVNGANFQTPGGVTDINAGSNSGGFNFDGSQDKITPSLPNLDFDQPFSIMGWINADSPLSKNVILSFGFSAGGDPFVFLDLFDNSDFRFIIEDNGGTIDIVSAGGGAANTWFHVAGVFDGTDMKLFVDGTLQSNVLRTAGTTSDIDQAGIGFLHRNKETNFVDGNLDDIRVYNTDLSNSQVSTIYNNAEP